LAKRIFDLVVGSILAIIAAPLVVLLAAAVALELRAWPFFVQHRVGAGGRPFRIVKLRTLPPSTPKYMGKDRLDFEGLPAFARWLRRTHLDELPQFINVVLGRMSIVGPRPEMEHIVATCEDSFARTRHSVKPGCTGLWQISERCVTMIADSPEFDLYYVRYGSLRLDIWVLWRTALFMLGVAPGIRLDQVPEWTGPATLARPVLGHARVADGRSLVTDGLLGASEVAA
jgi:lipopolysaccharide/colanic/teichoic acid biosynthesis glycosyltransferase